MRTLLRIFLVVVFAIAVSRCSGDGRNKDERDAEIQKKIQDATQKERKLYEGMQKGVEEIEKKAGENKGNK